MVVVFVIGLFLVAFTTIWLGVTSVIALTAGWFALAAAFPDRDEPALETIGGVSGFMGVGVSFRGVLSLAVCDSGLRVRIWRPLGPFSRPFLAPWSEIRVQRITGLFGGGLELKFGDAGRLSVFGNAADRLVWAAGSRWPAPAAA
ncbi:MAG TPA: hypothetical protein VKT30_01515 [Caulobacteraceae bacterium]|nr:hypothetical protein [Caulobacteraceae bacterium]